MASLDLDAELAALAQMDSKALAERWSALKGGPVPRVSAALLRLALAFELQAAVSGGVSRVAQQRLEQVAAAKTRTAPVRPGLRLAREWNGKVHVVTVSDDGVISWNGQTWTSLSQVARAIPAGEIERFVVQRLGQLLGDPMALAEQLGLTLDPTAMGQLIKRCALQAAELDLTPHKAAPFIDQVRIGARHVEIVLDLATLAANLDLQPGDITHPDLTLSEPVRMTTSGKVLRLVDDQGAAPVPRCDEPLVKMIHQARSWWATLCEGQLNVDELAKHEQVNPARLTRILRLAFLSPRVVDAVLAGQLKAGIGRYALIQPGAIAAKWSEQEARYLPGGVG